MINQVGKVLSVKRRGQANLVTIAILVGATLVMALALLSYFTGQASRASEERGLSDYLATLSYSIDTTIVAKYTYSTDTYLEYCLVIQVSWAQSTPMNLYLTVLPASRTSPNTVNVDTEILKLIPRDVIENPGLPKQRVFMYLLNDTDADGIVELIGRDNRIVLEHLPSCYELIANTTLRLYERTPIDVPMENLYLSPNINLKAFADQVNIYYDVPVWSLVFNPKYRVWDVFILIEVPLNTNIDLTKLSNLNLVFLGTFNNNYYASYYAPLPPP